MEAVCQAPHSSRKAFGGIYQTLAKTGQICQALANPYAARGMCFAKHWQKQRHFATK
jgi:hypothetical protein